jgi:hypothetical protein
MLTLLVKYKQLDCPYEWEELPEVRLATQRDESIVTCLIRHARNREALWVDKVVEVQWRFLGSPVAHTVDMTKIPIETEIGA